MSMDAAKKILTSFWILGAVILIAIFILQHMGGRFGNQQKEAWAWFLPNITPTLLLMIGAFIADAPSGNGQAKRVDKFMLLVVLSLSLFYLIALFTTILLNPIAHTYNPDRGYLELLQQSGLYLGPIHGLVSAALGAFFIKQKT
ncbi:MAG: hypothetical protein M3R15_02670 [Acidobacteriota bacterium]|nr:hypothetical protein [Acidobacteriota bacterium]